MKTISSSMIEVGPDRSRCNTRLSGTMFQCGHPSNHFIRNNDGNTIHVYNKPLIEIKRDLGVEECEHYDGSFFTGVLSKISGRSYLKICENCSFFHKIIW
jgi:hypothetical protein